MPLLTLRPRLLFSFNGSMMLRCFWGNARKFKSDPLDGTENDSTQLLMNSSVSRVFPPFSGTSASHSKKPIKNIKLPDKTKKKKKEKYAYLLY